MRHREEQARGVLPLAPLVFTPPLLLLLLLLLRRFSRGRLCATPLEGAQYSQTFPKSRELSGPEPGELAGQTLGRPENPEPLCALQTVPFIVRCDAEKV